MPGLSSKAGRCEKLSSPFPFLLSSCRHCAVSKHPSKPHCFGQWFCLPPATLLTSLLDNVPGSPSSLALEKKMGCSSPCRGATSYKFLLKTINIICIT